MNCEQANRIELRVPAEREMMLVIRLTTSGALARLGMSVDAVDDVKLAVEEACNCLIRSSGCSMLDVSYWTVDGCFCLRAEVGSCNECQSAQRVSDEEIAVIRCVLLSMVDEVQMDFHSDCLRAIDMRKRMPSRKA